MFRFNNDAPDVFIPERWRLPFLAGGNGAQA